MVEEIELKQCPFCGGEAYLIGKVGNVYAIECGYCSFKIGATTEKDVVEYWNTRQIEDDLNEQIGRFKKYADALEKEVKTLRAALETILDASQQDDPCVLGISVVAYEALKEGKKDDE